MFPKCKSFLWNPIKENTTNKIENTGITAPIISQTLSEKNFGFKHGKQYCNKNKQTDKNARLINTTIYLGSNFVKVTSSNFEVERINRFVCEILHF
jgi:hypothetical protein